MLVRVQSTLLGELLLNLLDNAIKYSAPGTPIVARLRVEAGWVVVSVEDGGPGFDESETAHLVEPFYRSQQARLLNPKGVGLGLSVASRIAQLFNGRIEIERRAAGLTVVSLWLPGVVSVGVE